MEDLKLNSTQEQRLQVIEELKKMVLIHMDAALTELILRRRLKNTSKKQKRKLKRKSIFLPLLLKLPAELSRKEIKEKQLFFI